MPLIGVWGSAAARYSCIHTTWSPREPFVSAGQACETVTGAVSVIGAVSAAHWAPVADCQSHHESAGRAVGRGDLAEALDAGRRGRRRRAGRAA